MDLLLSAQSVWNFLLNSAYIEINVKIANLELVLLIC